MAQVHSTGKDEPRGVAQACSSAREAHVGPAAPRLGQHSWPAHTHGCFHTGGITRAGPTHLHRDMKCGTHLQAQLPRASSSIPGPACP